ncbi:MAG TPA: hypothetical protein VK689_06155 [Armatimonadota bacterium]|nr:hypothetical protein [Armatimonadota bacterium]
MRLPLLLTGAIILALVGISHAGPFPRAKEKTPPPTARTPDEPQWPRRTTVDELNEMARRGDYHLVRRQKIAHEVEFRAEVWIARDTPLVRLPGGFWSAHLYHVPPDHGMKPGDTVRVRGLIVDEGYAALSVWVRSWDRVKRE